MTNKYPTSRRDFLKTSLLGSAAALTAWQLPSLHAAEGAPAAAPAAQPVFVPTDPANSPIGIPFGVKPGRVAWAFNPKSTSWDGVNNAPGWWDDSNTHPQIVEAMLSDTLRSVGDAASDKEAWNKIFTDFNKRKGKGAVAYKKGEKIVIKLNLNQMHDDHGNGANNSYIAPQLVQAMLRQLVQEVGAAPADITFYDAIRHVPDTIFDRCTKAFPGVHFVDSTNADGREKAVPDTTKPIVLGQGNVTMYFPTCVTAADYMINVAGLKGHGLAGMTVTAKNHLGSLLTATGEAAARNMHASITVKLVSPRPGGPPPAGAAPRGAAMGATGAAGATAATPPRGDREPLPVTQVMGSYNGLVDLNGHPQTGGKTILYIIDGLYATQHNEFKLAPVCKWQSAPFNGHWTSSLLASQDGVAIDSVALDFLRSEPTLAAIITGPVDNYLHEMALADKAPSKTAYQPAKDGKVLGSLGVHEHWNNAADKKYSRNLGKPTGIELVNLLPV
jgi:uncharacterized protein (DUF362 family)